MNVKSEDNECFFWSFVASLYPAATNVSKDSSYPHYSEVLRTDDMTVPVTLDQIAKFERFNDVSVNVYTWSAGSCVAQRLTEYKRERQRETCYWCRDPKEPQTVSFRVHSQHVETDIETTRQSQESSIRLRKVS